MFEVRIEVGAYTIALSEGWVLERLNGDTYETVNAVMTSDNPANFSIATEATTVVVLTFETADAEIEFAQGDLEVWLEVAHYDCEVSETVTRSCGDSGGYCLFTDANTYAQLTSELTIDTIDFETLKDGREVEDGWFVAFAGTSFSDKVTFRSAGASNQMFPAGSDTPFIGQVHDNVVLGGGWDTHEGYIRSSGGGGNFSGFDAIEAEIHGDTDETCDIRAASMTVENWFNGDFMIELYAGDGSEPAATLAMPYEGVDGFSMDHAFVGIARDPAARNPVHFTRIRIVPMPFTDSEMSTVAYQINDFSYGM